jgi:ABC-type phosphate transport system permease subunit
VNVRDLAGSVGILAGMFGLIVLVETMGLSYPAGSWQRRTCHLAVVALTAALLSVLALH